MSRKPGAWWRGIGKLICSGALLSGCAASKRMLEDLPPTMLEGRNLTTKLERLPFDHSWVSPSARWSSYKGIYIKPVRSDLLPKDSWRASQSFIIDSEESYQSEAKSLSKFFHAQLVKELGEHDRKNLNTPVQSPGANVAVVEIALTELEFSHPIQKAGSLAIPVPGSGIVVNSIADPYVTFALKITDGANGKLLATAADRKFAPTKLVNLNKLTVTSANREICEIWARELADTLSGDEFTKVEGKTWSLVPW